MGLLDSLKELISKEETPPVVPVVAETPPVVPVVPVVPAIPPPPVVPVVVPEVPVPRSHRSGDHHPAPWRRDFRSAHRRGDVHGDDPEGLGGPSDQE